MYSSNPRTSQFEVRLFSKRPFTKRPALSKLDQSDKFRIVRMFGWIKKRIEDASTDAMKNDIERFIASLKGAGDEEIATMLIVANVLRINLTKMGKIPAAALDLSIPRLGDIEIKCDMCPITLSSAIKQFQKIGQPTDALGCMIWLHSVRALNVPEIRVLGRDMWRQLSRGFVHLDDAIEDMSALIGTSLPKNIKDEVRFVPRGLEPQL
jgi:hypothetical protein